MAVNLLAGFVFNPCPFVASIGCRPYEHAPAAALSLSDCATPDAYDSPDCVRQGIVWVGCAFMYFAHWQRGIVPVNIVADSVGLHCVSGG